MTTEAWPAADDPWGTVQRELAALAARIAALEAVAGIVVAAPVPDPGPETPTPETPAPAPIAEPVAEAPADPAPEPVAAEPEKETG